MGSSVSAGVAVAAWGRGIAPLLSRVGFVRRRQQGCGGEESTADRSGWPVLAGTLAMSYMNAYVADTCGVQVDTA